MLERLKSFLKSLPGSGADTAQADADDPRVAAAALMFHVIDADGVRDEAERRRLREVLSQAYAITGHELDAVIDAGEEAEREAVDLYIFTSVLKRHLDDKARVEFVGLLWEMVYADGELHELEDNVVWRVAELIGVSSRDRTDMRRRVRGQAEAAGGDNQD
jgi:uncharacterized tellurite resistance protein B-like protein